MMQSAKRYFLLGLCIILFVGSSCSKEDEASPDNGEVTWGSGIKIPADLQGRLIYDWVDEGVLTVDTRTGAKSVLLNEEVRGNGFDISRDGRIRLTSTDIRGNYDASQYTLSNVADGSIVSQFEFYPPNGGSKYNSGLLSPDNSLIAIKPTFEEGIIILDKSGKEVVHLTAINNNAFTRNDRVEWLPGNGIVFTNGKYILKAVPPYTNATLVKEMNYQDWGNVKVSQDGQKISVLIDKHIYLMNIDGSNLTQVTTSKTQELEAVFSPDGKYLLVGSDFRRTGVFGAVHNLKIIPADGKLYDLDAEQMASSSAIPVIPKGETKIETSDGIMLWR
ncbi:TolB family protein [Pontibacter sp. 13R65]|uniref:TolB family protein n=1 Tax=Pontibacter sp. 13R65 TaxID=3127458 RepID=UPI00301D5936